MSSKGQTKNRSFITQNDLNKCIPDLVCVMYLCSKVDSLWLNGQWKEAKELSLKAHRWNFAGILMGAMIAVSTVLFAVFSILVFKQEFPNDDD